MENIVTYQNLAEYLSYYLKVSIFINKGTEDDTVLNKCINLCNFYKQIENTAEITNEQEDYIRKNIKRINLIFKLDSEGHAVDIRKKEFQSKMIYLLEHPSLEENNVSSMIEHVTENNINIFPGIPLMFVLRTSKYQGLLWQYTRLIFYMTQLFLSNTGPNLNSTDRYTITKQHIFDNSALRLEEILVNIEKIQETININKLMGVDQFLNSKLGNGIDKTKVNDATDEVKKILIKKGVGGNNSMERMIDSIASQITGADLTQGNVLQNMFGIAKNVADELRGDLEGNPDSLRNTIGTITEVFNEAINNSAEEMPADLKNIFNVVLSFQGNTSNGTTDPNVSEEELMKQLGAIVETNGLNKEEFFTSIKTESGEIDATKLENMLTTLKPAQD